METCTKLYILLKSQEELIAADIQGKSESIYRLQDFFYWCKKTIIILEQKMFKFKKLIVVKDEIIMILYTNLQATK